MDEGVKLSRVSPFTNPDAYKMYSTGSLSASFAAVQIKATVSSKLSWSTSTSRPSPGEINITASGATLERVTSTMFVAILS